MLKYQFLLRKESLQLESKKSPRLSPRSNFKHSISSYGLRSWCEIEGVVSLIHLNEN